MEREGDAVSRQELDEVKALVAQVQQELRDMSVVQHTQNQSMQLQLATLNEQVLALATDVINLYSDANKLASCAEAFQ